MKVCVLYKTCDGHKRYFCRSFLIEIQNAYSCHLDIKQNVIWRGFFTTATKCLMECRSKYNLHIYISLTRAMILQFYNKRFIFKTEFSFMSSIILWRLIFHYRIFQILQAFMNSLVRYLYRVLIRKFFTGFRISSFCYRMTLI